MRNIILFIAGLVDLSANVPYIRDAIKGKTKPNIASWSTWTVINGITIFAALKAGHATNTVILGFSYFIGTFSTLLIAFLKGTRQYTIFDGTCQLLAIIGVVLWQLSGNPNIAFYL